MLLLLAIVRINVLHPVSVRRFPSFRTQPLENLSADSVTNRFLSNPAPGENIISGNLVMETGCIMIVVAQLLGLQHFEAVWTYLYLK